MRRGAFGTVAATLRRACPPCSTSASSFVIGKGGVGKSTVAAALGLPPRGAGCGRSSPRSPAGARRGRSASTAAGCDEIELAPGLFTHLDRSRSTRSRSTCASAAGARARRRARRQRASSTYFAAATPGLRELLTIGKIWELAQVRAAHAGRRALRPRDRRRAGHRPRAGDAARAARPSRESRASGRSRARRARSTRRSPTARTPAWSPSRTPRRCRSTRCSSCARAARRARASSSTRVVVNARAARPLLRRRRDDRGALDGDAARRRARRAARRAVRARAARARSASSSRGCASVGDRRRLAALVLVDADPSSSCSSAWPTCSPDAGGSRA